MFNSVNTICVDTQTVNVTWPSSNEFYKDGSEKEYKPIFSEDHIQVEYLEATGTQYIDLGPDTNISKAEIKGGFTSITSNKGLHLFGAWADGTHCYLGFAHDQANFYNLCIAGFVDIPKRIRLA